MRFPFFLSSDINHSLDCRKVLSPSCYKTCTGDVTRIHRWEAFVWLLPTAWEGGYSLTPSPEPATARSVPRRRCSRNSWCPQGRVVCATPAAAATDSHRATRKLGMHVSDPQGRDVQQSRTRSETARNQERIDGKHAPFSLIVAGTTSTVHISTRMRRTSRPPARQRARYTSFLTPKTYAEACTNVYSGLRRREMSTMGRPKPGYFVLPINSSQEDLNGISAK